MKKMPQNTLQVLSALLPAGVMGMSAALASTPPVEPPSNANAGNSKCIGKVFVAKGEKAPSGVTAGEVVKQDDLTTNLRVVLPVDGVGDFHSDPNRLTLVIGEDGKIVDAAWD